MMYKIIKSKIERLTLNDMKLFCNSKNITCDDKELIFIFNYIKKNYETILNNPKQALIEVKPYLSDSSFNELENLYLEYHNLYPNYL